MAEYLQFFDRPRVGFELSVPLQTVILDTTDPLAGRVGRSRRETAPRWDFGYTLCRDLDGYRVRFFSGMP